MLCCACHVTAHYDLLILRLIILLVFEFTV